jgi:hypothetical protein
VSRATRCIASPKSKNVLSTQSYRPYGTGRLLGRSQAINCLATIIQSLRDNKPPLPVHILEATSLRVAGFEDEDDDEDENEANNAILPRL